MARCDAVGIGAGAPSEAKQPEGSVRPQAELAIRRIGPKVRSRARGEANPSLSAALDNASNEG